MHWGQRCMWSPGKKLEHGSLVEAFWKPYGSLGSPRFWSSQASLWRTWVIRIPWLESGEAHRFKRVIWNAESLQCTLRLVKYVIVTLCYHTTAEQVHHCWASVVWLILKTLSRSCSQPRLVWHLSMLFHLAWGPIPHNQVVVTLAAIWQPKQCWCWRCLQKVSRTSWKPKEGGTRATAELSHRTPLQHHNWCSLAFQIKTL